MPKMYQSVEGLKKLIKKGEISIHAAGAGYCSSGYKCNMDNESNPALCMDCDSQIYTDESFELLLDLHKELCDDQKNAEDFAGGNLIMYSGTMQIKMIEHMLQKANVAFEPFTN